MLLRAMMASGGGGGGSYLDGLAVQPRSALSLQKVISSATNAIRVRRSSDNAEQDIGFTGDALDTTALASFAGSASCFVKTWYDQTGNAKHLAFATSGAQPRIVNAGSYDGKLVFNGTSHAGMIAALTDGTTDKLGIYTRIGKASTSATQIIAELSSNYNATSQKAAVVYADLGAIAIGMANIDSFNMASVPSLTTLSALFDRAGVGRHAQYKLFRDGTDLNSNGSTSLPVSGNFGAFDFYVGARAASSLFAAMELESMILYTADSLSIRASVEAIIL